MILRHVYTYIISPSLKPYGLLVGLLACTSLVGCRLSDDRLRGSIQKISQTVNEAPSPQNWSFKTLTKGAISDDSSPAVVGSLEPGTYGSSAVLFLDETCSTEVGRSVISDGDFEISNLDLASSVGESKQLKFYGQIETQDGQTSDCIDLDLNFAYYFENDFIWLAEPQGLALDEANSWLYVVDGSMFSLVKFDLVSGTRTVVSNAVIGEGPQLGDPIAVDLNNAKSKAYVLSNLSGNNSLIEVDLKTGDRKVIFDSTTGSGPTILTARALSLSAAGTHAYIVGINVDAVVEVDLATGNRTIISGSSVGTGPSFDGPSSICLNKTETLAYVGDANLNALIEVDLATGNRTIISNSSTGSGPDIDYPKNIALNSSETIAYISNLENILKVDLATGNRTVVSDASTGTGPSFTDAFGLKMISDESKAYITDSELGLVFEIDMSTGSRESLSSSNVGSGDSDFLFIQSLTLGSSKTAAYLVSIESGNDIALVKIDLDTGNRTVFSGGSSSTGTGPSLTGTVDIAVNSSETKVYLSNSTSDMIMEIDISTGNRTDISSSGVGTGTNFSYPSGIQLSADDTKAYVVDRSEARLFEVDLATGNRTSVSSLPAGSSPAYLDKHSADLVVDASEAKAYIISRRSTSDTLIEVNLSTGTNVTVSDPSTGTGPAFATPISVALSPDETKVYVTDLGSFPDPGNIYEVDLSTGDRSLVLTDETIMRFPAPYGIAVNKTDGTTYISDSQIKAIIKMDLETKTSKVISK
ncbi:MAG: hypothetical protein CL675_12015 [Bdellovibrionaceae bacterium]|nr:hypothetical protein [Pseudobdellovibrionaceae bacterium]